MPRARIGAARRKRIKKIMARAKGYRSARHRLHRTAREAVMRAGRYGYFGRRIKKRDFRSLWIIRINAALEPLGLSYSRFINGLKKANISLNRKALAELAISEPRAFADIAEKARAAIASP